MEEFIGGEYRVVKKIGQGSFGKIFIVKDLKTGVEYAAKQESANAPIPQLLFESRLYKIMSGSTNVPRIHGHYFEQKQNTIIIDLLGKSLEEYLNRCNRRMSLKTVLMLADQMLTSIEFFHSKNYIHRDIKPDNFVMGLNDDSNKLYIIDYGLAKKYRDQHTHEHIAYIEGKSLTGTARYASINALSGCEQSRRDDMEAIGYVMIYLLKGHLPWMGIDGATNQERYRKIAECKRNTPLEVLCENLPKEIIVYMRKVRSLKFTEKPQYAAYRKLFRTLFNDLKFTFDYQYDWTPKKAEADVPPQRYTKKKANEAAKVRRPSMEAVFSGERRNRSEEAMKTIDFDNQELDAPKNPVAMNQIETNDAQDSSNNIEKPVKPVKKAKKLIRKSSGTKKEKISKSKEEKPSNDQKLKITGTLQVNPKEKPRTPSLERQRSYDRLEKPSQIKINHIERINTYEPPVTNEKPLKKDNYRLNGQTNHVEHKILNKKIEKPSNSYEEKEDLCEKPSYLRELDELLAKARTKASNSSNSKPSNTSNPVTFRKSREQPVMHLPPPPIMEGEKIKKRHKIHRRSRHAEDLPEENVIPQRVVKPKPKPTPEPERIQIELSDDEPMTTVDEFLMRRGLLKRKKV